MFRIFYQVLLGGGQMVFRSNFFFIMMRKTYCFLQTKNFIRSIILGLYMLNNKNSPSDVAVLVFFPLSWISVLLSGPSRVPSVSGFLL